MKKPDRKTRVFFLTWLYVVVCQAIFQEVIDSTQHLLQEPHSLQQPDKRGSRTARMLLIQKCLRCVPRGQVWQGSYVFGARARRRVRHRVLPSDQ